MSGQFWLTDKQVERLRPHFPKPRGKPRVDDRRVLSGVLFVLRNGLRWQDAPAVYGPHKTLYNRFVRWSRLGVFARIFRDLARPGADGDTLMMDSTHLKAHRTAASLRKGGRGRGPLVARKAASTPSSTWSATAKVGHSTSFSRRVR
jgi:putative transposase